MHHPDLIINFAPTGMIPTKELTPHVPLSPSEIIETVHEANEIGITIAHLHARDREGVPTYLLEVYEEIISGVRKHCPELLICLSLSGRDFPRLEQRSQALKLCPDMGSLTLSSLNFSNQASVNSPDMIKNLIHEMDYFGVHPELECFDVGMINYSKYLISKRLLKPPYYYNILLGNIAGAQVNALHLGMLLNDLPENSLWSLAGLGKGQLKANTIAIALGGGVRVGLEDNIWHDVQRTRLATNLDLLTRVHEIASIFERNVMPSSVLGQKGLYNTHRNQTASI